MRFPLLSLSLLAMLAACGAPAKQDPKDPAFEPAVIKTASNLPPLHAADSGTRTSSLIPTDPRQLMPVILSGYSVVTATMIHQDARFLGQVYDPNATLTTPDSALKGNPAIVRQLMALARTKALSDFVRTSRAHRTLDDSTLADSGDYVMVLKRTRTDSMVERGRYTTKWRARADITKWVILEDHLLPGKIEKPKGKGAR